MKTKYKTIFISDIHLGCQACKDQQLLKFLKKNQCETLYLVGDIVDGWRLKRKFRWPQSHNDIVRSILTAAKNGTHVIYVIGNHDEILRDWSLLVNKLGNVEIVNESEYTTIKGKKLLVVHGDMFDTLMQAHAGKLIMHLGDRLYDMLIVLNNIWSKIRSMFGLPYWSLSKAVKKGAKQVVSFVTHFENLMVDYCESKDYDGVVCGHIHTPGIKDIDGLMYYNCGDWLENCSAIVETLDGDFELKFF